MTYIFFKIPEQIANRRKENPMSSNQNTKITPWIVVKTLLAGWGLWTIFILWLLPMFVGENLGVAVVPSDPIGTVWTILTAPIGIQFSLARPFSFPLAFGLPLVVWGLSGLLVAALNRGKHAAGVVVLAGSVLTMNLLVGGYVLERGSAPYISASYLAANAAAAIVGILVGGVLVTGLTRMSRPVTEP
jgi:hypothetical protein